MLYDWILDDDARAYATDMLNKHEIDKCALYTIMCAERYVIGDYRDISVLNTLVDITIECIKQHYKNKHVLPYPTHMLGIAVHKPLKQD